MKVSEWLRRLQLTGEVPETPPDDPMLAFWCGWLLGAATRGIIELPGRTRFDQARDYAIRAAEFIEERAK